MFRSTRVLHRWIGLISSLFMVSMAITGLLLAVKKRFDWIQPPAQEASEIASMAEIASLDTIANSVFAAGIPQMQKKDDFDRFELHVDKNLFKVTSKDGYHEVQVDAKTGKVLSVARRNDQMIEHLHDMSYFSEGLHTWVLPTVAVALRLLGLTGIFMFFVPVYRRWQFRRKGAPPPKKA